MSRDGCLAGLRYQVPSALKIKNTYEVSPTTHCQHKASVMFCVIHSSGSWFYPGAPLPFAGFKVRIKTEMAIKTIRLSSHAFAYDPVRS